MRAISILQRTVVPVLAAVMHLSRLRALMFAVQSLLDGERLNLTSLGRSGPSQTAVKHRIKRIDRLLGNKGLAQQSDDVFRVMAMRLVGDNTRPVVLLDWTESEAHPDQAALVASVPIPGRSLPLYMEIHPKDCQKNPRVEKNFLTNLRKVLPWGCCPTLIVDGGFGNVFFAAVRELGWHFVGRLGCNVSVRLEGKEQWVGVAEVYEAATAVPMDLGTAEVGRRLLHRQQYRLVLFKDPPRLKAPSAHRMRRKPTLRSDAQKNARKRALDPWLLGTSLTQEEARQVVDLYRRRMRIEQLFRDLKNHRFGWFLEDARSDHPERILVLLMIATLALIAVVLAGWEGEQQGAHHRYQANTVRSRRVLSLFLLGKLLIRSGEVPAVPYPLESIASLLSATG